MSRLVWMNGDLIPESEARVSIYDSALMFGDTIFEMTRSFNKKHFKLPEHLDRLYASAKYMEIEIPYEKAELQKIVLKTAIANHEAGVFQKDDECRMMIDVTRGLLSLYHDVDIPHKGVNVIVSAFPLRWTTAGMGKLFDTGVNLVIPSQRQVPSSVVEARVKHRSRINFMKANIEVSKIEGENNWPILLDPDGYLTEGPGYNLFTMLDHNYLIPQGRNTLRGISRRYILDQVCPKWIERNLLPYDLYNTEEAFITATPFCMLPVTSVNGVPIGDGKPGKDYQRLLNDWSEDVRVDIKGQIQKWDSERKEIHGGVSPYGFKHN